MEASIGCRKESTLFNYDLKALSVPIIFHQILNALNNVPTNLVSLNLPLHILFQIYIINYIVIIGILFFCTNWSIVI